MIALRALAKSWKSGSGGQTSQIDRFSKGFNKEMIALRALAESWKSSSGGQASQIDCYSKDLIRKL